jgi:hypothetical protein
MDIPVIGLPLRPMKLNNLICSAFILLASSAYAEEVQALVVDHGSGMTSGASVPETGSVLGMAAVGLIALIAVRRKLAK